MVELASRAPSGNALRFTLERFKSADQGRLVLHSSGFLTLPGFRHVASEQIRAGEGAPVRVSHPDRGLRMAFTSEMPIPGGWCQLELQFPADGLVDVVAQFLFANDRVLWLRLPLIGRNHFLAHLRTEGAIKQLTLIVNGSGRLTEPTLSRFERVGWMGQLAATARRGRDIFRRDGLGVLSSGLNYLWRRARGSSIALSRGSAALGGEAPYETWMRIFDEHPGRGRARHEARLATLARQPPVSIMAELSSADPKVLDRLARSMSEQIYPAWELLLVVPPPLHQDIGAGLAIRGLKADKYRIVHAGANTADSLNAALAVSQGEYILPLTEGALLRPHALLDLILTIERVPSAGLVYSDEDRIDAAGARNNWRFKPAWSPDLFEASDYVEQVVLMRRDTVRTLGGWSNAASEPKCDLVLRLARSTEPRPIVHLAKLLVHGPAEEKAPRHCCAKTRPRSKMTSGPRVSLIIPTRDNADMLATCVRSIRSNTRYDNYEVLIIDNGSVEDQTKRLFNVLSSDPAIRVRSRPEPFNFSRLNNSGAHEATGAILGLINNDIEVRREDWLDEMVALAMRPEVGCVGAKLLYPDGRIQHGGVVLGLYGVAGHAHRFARGDAHGYLDRLCTVQNVSAVTAACLLIRKEVFDEVGGLDENLAVAFNDVDFCLKVRAAGYLNLWTPFAELIHHESASRGRDLAPAKAKRFASEYAIMQQRWGEQLLHDPYYSPHLTYDAEDFSLRLR